MSKKVGDYVKQQLSKGYDSSTIRQVMIKYGYSSKDIDEGFRQAYGQTVRHEIHLSKTTIAVIFIILASIGGTVFYLYKPAVLENQLLDVGVETLTNSAESGGKIKVIIELTNMGSSKRYDVEIKKELISKDGKGKMNLGSETVAVETTLSKQIEITVPNDAVSGDYILRIIADYDNKKASATTPIKIISKKTPSEEIPNPEDNNNEESCEDKIKNQDEENVDCGGVCKKCEEEIEPSTYCGDGICNEANCDLDCKSDEVDENEEIPSIDEIKSIAVTDPSRAQGYCSRVEIPDLKDNCFSNIAEVQSNKNYCNLVINLRLKDVCYLNLAKKSKDNSLCAEITTDGRRDSCYMAFVTDYKDYSVCPRITNSALKQSCEYLKQIYEINQKAQTQQANSNQETDNEETITGQV